jgi:hypothetical protein
MRMSTMISSPSRAANIKAVDCFSFSLEGGRGRGRGREREIPVNSYIKKTSFHGLT